MRAAIMSARKIAAVAALLKPTLAPWEQKVTAQARGKTWASLGAAIFAIAAGVFTVEGGYSNNPADPGGETNHGVTVQVARDHGYTGSMRELPKETAQQIYVGSYVEGPAFTSLQCLQPLVKS